MFSTWLGAERRAASCSRLRRGRAGKPRENQRLKLPCGGVEVDVPRSPAITRLIFFHPASSAPVPAEAFPFLRRLRLWLGADAGGGGGRLPAGFCRGRIRTQPGVQPADKPPAPLPAPTAPHELPDAAGGLSPAVQGCGEPSCICLPFLTLKRQHVLFCLPGPASLLSSRRFSPRAPDLCCSTFSPRFHAFFSPPSFFFPLCCLCIAFLLFFFFFFPLLFTSFSHFPNIRRSLLLSAPRGLLSSLPGPVHYAGMLQLHSRRARKRLECAACCFPPSPRPFIPLTCKRSLFPTAR